MLGRLLAAAALAASGLLHLDLAADYAGIGDDISLGTLFRVQGVVALAVALWVLLRRRDRLPVVAALVVGAGSLVPLVLSTYVRVPSVGPLPALYEPVWYASKTASALAAAVAALAAAVVLAGLRRARLP